MKSYVFLLSIISAVFGRPEPPSPYQYNALSVSYGSPPKDSYGSPPKDSYGYPAPNTHDYDSYQNHLPSDSYGNHIPSDSYDNQLPSDSYSNHLSSDSYSGHTPSYSHSADPPSYSHGTHALSDTYGAPHHDNHGGHQPSYSHGAYAQSYTYGAPHHDNNGAHPPNYSHGNHASSYRYSGHALRNIYGAPHHDSHFDHPQSDTYGVPRYQSYGIPQYGLSSYYNQTTFNITIRNPFLRNETGPPGPLDSESFIVDIVPNVDGVTNFTMDQIMMLSDSLNMTLFNDPDLGLLHFDSAGPNRGVFRVVAADRFSRDWLLRIVPTLEGLWPNRMIRAVSVGSTPRTITATIMMPVPGMDPNTFLMALRTQNPSIDTTNWSVTRGPTQQGMQLWTLNIDERSVPALRALTFRPFMGFNRVTISPFNSPQITNPQNFRQFVGPQGPFGGPQGPFGGPQGPFGGPQGPFGGPQGPFGGPQGQFGGPQGPFGGPQGPFGGPQGPIFQG